MSLQWPFSNVTWKGKGLTRVKEKRRSANLAIYIYNNNITLGEEVIYEYLC